MTDMALAHPTRRIGSGLIDLGQAIAATYRLGGRTLVIAPALVAIVVVPEFLQHVAEIRLGMFTGVDAFRAHSSDPIRMVFGVAKIAGLVIAMLVCARFWAVGTVRQALLIRPATLLRLAVVLAIGFALTWPLGWLGRHGIPIALNIVVRTVSVLIQGVVILYFTGVLLQDRANTVRRTATTLLPAMLVQTLLAVLAFAPTQVLHMATHRLALGQPGAIVWLLMTADALLVGLLAALVGAALFVGYRTGLTWRGWTVRPVAIDGEARQG